MANTQLVRRVRIRIASKRLVRLATWLLLAAFVLALAYALDPADRDWGAADWPPAKYAPTTLAVIAAPLYLLATRGVPIFRLPIVCALSLAFLMLGGGLYTVGSLHADLADSFVGRGLCMLSILPFYIMAWLPRERALFTRVLVKVLVPWGLAAGLILIAHKLGFPMASSKHIYHEQALYFPAAGLVFALSSSIWRRRIATGLFAGFAALTVKITGFVFAGISGFFLLAAERLRGAQENLRSVMLRRLLLLQGALGVAVTAGVVAVAIRAILPTGSPDVRLATYNERWLMFRDSPIWGQLFVGSPIMDVGWLVIPSHSDLIDILAFGGVLGVLLLVLSTASATVHALRNIGMFHIQGRLLSLIASSLWFAAAFTATFNPIIHQPKLAVGLWFSLAVLLADREMDSLRKADELAAGGSRGLGAEFRGRKL